MNRVRLWGPAGPSLPVLRRYVVAFTRVSADASGQRFEAWPSVPFMPERLVCAVGLPVSPAHAFWLKWFGWIRYPRLRLIELDPLDAFSDEAFDALSQEQIEALSPERKLRVDWRYPVRERVGRSQDRERRRLTAGCVVTRLTADTVEVLAGSPAPLAMFSPVAVAGSFFSVPAVLPGQRIAVETTPCAAPIQFTMIGCVDESTLPVDRR